MKARGRPREGKEVKETYAVRLEPSFYKFLIKKYGSFKDVFKKDMAVYEKEKRKAIRELKKAKKLDQ